MTLPTQAELEAMPLLKLRALKRKAAYRTLFFAGKHRGSVFEVQATFWSTLHELADRELARRKGLTHA